MLGHFSLFNFFLPLRDTLFALFTLVLCMILSFIIIARFYPMFHHKSYLLHNFKYLLYLFDVHTSIVIVQVKTSKSRRHQDAFELKVTSSILQRPVNVQIYYQWCIQINYPVLSWIYFCLNREYIRNWIAACILEILLQSLSLHQIFSSLGYLLPLHWVKTTLSWRVTVSVDSWIFSMIFMQWF